MLVWISVLVLVAFVLGVFGWWVYDVMQVIYRGGGR